MPPALAFLNPRLTTKNVGDIFIDDSAKRILVHDRERSIDVDPRHPISPSDIDRINDCNAAVIVGTNLWHRQIFRPGRWMIQLDDLKKIRVPVIPFGVGTSRRFDEDDGFEKHTLELIRAIHAQCTLGSVRDPRTATALSAAGISNVVMTGCPTMFRSLAPRWELRRQSARRIAVTLRDGQKRNAKVLVAKLRGLGLEPVIAAQKPKDRFCRWPLPFVAKPPPTLFEYDITPYLKLVDESLGAVGWRLHGNMLHLALGNRAVFFANNSRAQSFCEAFGLPCIASRDGEVISPQRIAEHAERVLVPETFRPVERAYTQIRAEMVRFLEANGLEHRLGCG